MPNNGCISKKALIVHDVILPPFHLAFEQGTQDLYAVAFVMGQYAGPDGNGREDCFSVIYFRPSSTPHPFCLMSITAEGQTFNYTNPRVKNVNHIIMWAWDENGVYPAEWILYCEKAEKIAAQIADPDARHSYQEVVRDTAETNEMFYRRRFAREAGEAYMEKHGKTPASITPLFRFQSGRQQSALTLTTAIRELEDDRPGV